MNIETFVQDFASQFEETPASEFNATTRFRDLEEWDSMIALSVMAMIHENYEVKITPNEMIQAQTIQELYDLAQTKK